MCMEVSELLDHCMYLALLAGSSGAETTDGWACGTASPRWREDNSACNYKRPRKAWELPIREQRHKQTPITPDACHAGVSMPPHTRAKAATTRTLLRRTLPPVSPCRIRHVRGRIRRGTRRALGRPTFLVCRQVS